MSKVNFDVEFFEGENERLLLNTTLNDIELEQLPLLHDVLQNYLDASLVDATVTSIELDGCDDAVIYFASSDQPKRCEICSETTFEQMFQMIEDAAG